MYVLMKIGTHSMQRIWVHREPKVGDKLMVSTAEDRMLPVLVREIRDIGGVDLFFVDRW